MNVREPQGQRNYHHGKVLQCKTAYFVWSCIGWTGDRGISSLPMRQVIVNMALD